MAQLPYILGLVALVLLFISTLIYHQLGAQGVPMRRIRLLLAELWIAFVLITVDFIMLDQFIGPSARVGGGDLASNILRETAERWQLIRALPLWQQGFLLIGILAAVGVFAHLIWSFREVQRARPVTEEEDTHE